MTPLEIVGLILGLMVLGAGMAFLMWFFSMAAAFMAAEAMVDKNAPPDAQKKQLQDEFDKIICGIDFAPQPMPFFPSSYMMM